ncbi:tyrosine-protein kinase HTK16 isoform X2 [Patella vulgata]|uniref:tyrosine-protein kinase HTK16 isoform X2 n=1 Tax=Patella vulgata TaxID=6465 RepID=UPI0021805FEE|nr:tyrosine-protein kinase HTK16 isoform X2 [Patella vulgata]
MIKIKHGIRKLNLCHKMTDARKQYRVADLKNSVNVGTNESPRVSKLLKTLSLDDLLAAERKKEEENDQRVQWFHGSVTREGAETLLREGKYKAGDEANSDGLFLIRESGKNFALSLISNNKCFHFIIEQKSPGYFQIDDGPKIKGLDKLVDHYNSDSHGLPSKLSLFCGGKSPPVASRHRGFTNLLHRAVVEENEKVVEKILQHSKCPEINAKNAKGATALHEASELGLDRIVSMLLKHGADVTIRDANHHTPLQRAAVTDHDNTIHLLTQTGKSDPFDESPHNGWTALHEAAMRGHIKSVKILLSLCPCPYPRNADKNTPYHLAKTYGRNECQKYFEKYKLPEVIKQIRVYYHSELDREGAIKLFEVKGKRDGLFLIRTSTKRDPASAYVLSVCYMGEPHNYVIKNKFDGELKKHCYFIDKGPYLLSLEHLIYYYSRWEGGLPCILLAAITTNFEIDEIPRHEDYYNLSLDVNTTVTNKAPHKPILPPRLEATAPPPPLQSTIPTSPKIKTQAPPLPSERPPPVRGDLRKSDGAKADFTKPHASLSRKGSGGAELEAQPAKIVSEIKEIKEKHIKKGNILGEGEYGSVIKGVLTVSDGLISKKKIEVAIKTFHEGCVGSEPDFLREAEVMGSLDHKCITKLLGVCNEKTKLMLVEEYVPMGSMLDYLIDHKSEIEIKVDLYLWAGQIAQGMEYLESKNLVHRDLAARNILLASKRQIKISDFGLSRMTGENSDYYQASAGGRWPIKWYAPESVNYGKFTHASDVWSYGVTLWEMFSFGEPPYGEKKGIEVLEFIEQGCRLPKPEKCPDRVYDLMLSCWKLRAVERPTFNNLFSEFKHDEYSTVYHLLK